MTRPPNPDSREMTRRSPNDAKATRQSVPRAIGRNTRDATPYDEDERTVAEPEVSEETISHSKQLDSRLAEATDAADAAQEGGRNPKAQLNPEPEKAEPDTIERGRKAAPPAHRRDAGQSRTGEG